jgi:hypothetical protein
METTIYGAARSPGLGAGVGRLLAEALEYHPQRPEILRHPLWIGDRVGSVKPSRGFESLPLRSLVCSSKECVSEPAT